MIGLLIREMLVHDMPIAPFLDQLPLLMATYSALIGVLGGISGAIFAGLLAFAERRRSFHDLSVRRLAGWGVIAGAAIPTVLVLGAPKLDGGKEDPLLFLGFAAALGTASAVGTLLLARRGANSDVAIENAMHRVESDADVEPAR